MSYTIDLVDSSRLQFEKLPCIALFNTFSLRQGCHGMSVFAADSVALRFLSAAL